MNVNENKRTEEIIEPYRQYMYSYPHKTAYMPLSDIVLSDYMAFLSGGKNSLYFHIPFCQYKCGYCNLFSLAGQPEKTMERYVDAIERQAEQWADLLPEDAVFSDLTLGGGTPLLLPPRLLRRIFRIARDYFHMNCRKQWVVVETSPNQTTPEKCCLLKEEGVNRISMGVQSFDRRDLEFLHRQHSAERVEEAVRAIRETGFECFNMDFIYGISGQTVSSLQSVLQRALSLEPDELFVYPLYIKTGTALAREHAAVSEDIFDLGCFVRSYLTEHGFRPCSMRRFVRGKEAQEHSCGFENTLSIGCGGRSYLGNLHFCTPYAVSQGRCLSILENYIGQRDFRHPSHGYILSEDEQKRRYAIKNLLYCSGLDRADYHKNFGEEPEKAFPFLKTWVTEGSLEVTPTHFLMTERGFLLSDYLGPQFISDEVRHRMERAVIE